MSDQLCCLLSSLWYVVLYLTTFIWRHYTATFVWSLMGMVMLAWVRGSIKIKKVRGRVKNGVNEASTLNGRVCFTFIQYAWYSIKWFVAVVLIVNFRFFRMLPKKLQMELHKRAIKKAGVDYLGHYIFYRPLLLINLHKCINSKFHP